MAKHDTLPRHQRRKSSPARTRPKPPDGKRKGSLPALDRKIHERVRLGIVSALAVNESLTFKELKALLKITDGNLSAHARKLEDARYIECKKSFEGRFPKTEYRLTREGRTALHRYLNHMESLIQATREG